MRGREARPVAPVHRPLALATLLLLAAAGTAQQQPRPVVDPDSAFDRLLAQLQAEPRPLLSRRIELVRTFLDDCRGKGDHPLVLRARVRLGNLLLQQLDGTNALVAFKTAHDLAPAGDHDLRGAALLGVAQAQELLEKDDEALATLGALITKLAGTRYADAAQVERNRLQHRRELAIGEPLPKLRLGIDIRNREVRFDLQQGRPYLLVFWSADHDSSRTRLDRLAQTWLQAGMPADTLLAFALQDDAAALGKLADQQGWKFPILPAAQGFLHPDWLQLRITGVPTTLLVARDGTLLLRDPSPDRLAAALGQVR